MAWEIVTSMYNGIYSKGSDPFGLPDATSLCRQWCATDYGHLRNRLVGCRSCSTILACSKADTEGVSTDVEFGILPVVNGEFCT